MGTGARARCPLETHVPQARRHRAATAGIADRGKAPEVNAGEIASILAIHASTLSGILSRLEAGGMIRRKVDPEDRRRSHFVLTAAGRRVDRRRQGTVESAVKRALDKAPASAAAGCAEILELLVAELQGETDDK